MHQNMNDRLMAEPAYELIKKKSWWNIAVQAGSGFFGFSFTMMADAAVIPTVYVPMWNEIRNMYGQGEIELTQAKAILVGVGPVVLVDVIVDKGFGQIPILGVPANYFCAKVLTWRLGSLFTFFSSRGEDVDSKLSATAIEFLTFLFPKKDFGIFKTPDKSRFVDLVTRISRGSTDQVKDRLERAISVARGDE